MRFAHPRDVHIWFDRLDDVARRMSWTEDDARFDANERNRLARLRGAHAKRNFAAAHLYQRQVLSLYLGRPAHRVKLSATADGKPLCLQTSADATRLHFNLSHSDTRVALAVTPGGAVGIDVEDAATLERLNSQDLSGLSAAFSETEQHDLKDLPSPARRQAILRAWTVKEARAKATGKGLPEILAQARHGAIDCVPIWTGQADGVAGGALSFATLFAPHHTLSKGHLSVQFVPDALSTECPYGSPLVTHSHP